MDFRVYLGKFWILLWLMIAFADSFRPQRTVEDPEASCICVNESIVDETREQLSRFLQLHSTKLRYSSKSIMHTANTEFLEQLEWSRYRVLKEIRRVHEPLMIGDFVIGPISEFYQDLKRQTIEIKLSADLNPRLFNGNKHGRAVKETASYFSRMVSFFKTLNHVEHLASSLENRTSRDCARRMAEVTRCDHCLTKRTRYCRESCIDGVNQCLGNLSDEWNRHVRMLAFSKGALSGELGLLEEALIHAFSHAADHSLSLVAGEVVTKCGTLITDNLRGRHAERTKLVPPRGYSVKAADLANKFILYENFWLREGSRLCSDWSSEARCWNGNRHVNTSPHLMALTKNVGPADLETAPRRLIPFSDQINDPLSRLEGSSFLPFDDSDSDDEDLVVGSSGDDRFDIFSTITVTVTPGPYTTLSPRKQEVPVNLDDDSERFVEKSSHPIFISFSLFLILLINLFYS